LRCRICGASPESCCLHSFLQKRSADCACTWKTQALVYAQSILLVDRVVGSSNVRVERERSLFCVEKGWPCRYDVVFYDAKTNRPLLVLEVDGIQHFVKSMRQTDKSFATLLRRDLQKEEEAVRAGVTVIRFYQEDIWKARFDWKRLIVPLIERAFERNLEPCVVRQPHKLYNEGLYFSMRVGTIVDVGDKE